MKMNVSMLRDYIKCPQLAYNAHVLRRGLAGSSANLEVGTLFHEAMDCKLKGLPSDPERPPSYERVSDKARAEWEKHKLWLPIKAWNVPPEWRIVASEIALEKQDGVIGYVGRLDAIIEYNGKFWSLQWKTYAGDGLLELCEKVRLSFHEAAYQWLAEQNGYKPWGGTILGACNKLPGYRIIGGKRQEIGDGERERALTFHYLFRSPAKQTEMQLQMRKWSTRACIDMGHDRMTPQPRNYDMCHGPFGRGRCPYYSVCHEGASLEDDTFITLEDRYAVSDREPSEPRGAAAGSTAEDGRS
jgi:hypothetical protein